MKREILELKIMIRNLGLELNRINDKINQIIDLSDKFNKIPFLIEKIDKIEILKNFLTK